jgi:hypothetical protein
MGYDLAQRGVCGILFSALFVDYTKAEPRSRIDQIVPGRRASFSHASQAAPMTLSKFSKTRLESQSARMYCQMSSAGFIFGARIPEQRTLCLWSV